MLPISAGQFYACAVVARAACSRSIVVTIRQDALGYTYSEASRTPTARPVFRVLLQEILQALPRLFLALYRGAPGQEASLFVTQRFFKTRNYAQNYRKSYTQFSIGGTGKMAEEL